MIFLPGRCWCRDTQYPDLINNTVIQEVEKIRRNIWLELNSYLTVLEQVNIINRIFLLIINIRVLKFHISTPKNF